VNAHGVAAEFIMWAHDDARSWARWNLGGNIPRVIVCSCTTRRRDARCGVISLCDVHRTQGNSHGFLVARGLRRVPGYITKYVFDATERIPLVMLTEGVGSSDDLLDAYWRRTRFQRDDTSDAYTPAWASMLLRVGSVVGMKRQKLDWPAVLDACVDDVEFRDALVTIVGLSGMLDSQFVRTDMPQGAEQLGALIRARSIDLSRDRAQDEDHER
jgi:hypothetical protein